MNVHDLYASLGPRFRGRRMRRFAEAFGIDERTRVLDVGGSHPIWTLLPVRPEVVLLNLLVDREHGDGFRDVVGDARRLPFKDDAFDLVFSNSLIEHLSTFEQQQQFADECRRVGRRYYVQAPNRRFLVEPHLLTPVVHWLPRAARRRLLRNFTVWGLIARPSPEYCRQFVEELRLPTERDLRRMFPQAEIWHERVLGMSKSLMAVKRAP
jgi:ubiquinone/menaquinone biosynthesis C-methylase UbiE